MNERSLRALFDLGLVVKAVDGTLEVIGGILVLLVPPMLVVRIAEVVTAGELATDPNDFIATHLRQAAHTFALHTHYLIALYLVLHGAVKVVLVALIVRGHPLAYPFFIAALGIFGSYEAYRAVATGSALLAGLAMLDALIIVLTAHEYHVRYPERA